MQPPDKTSNETTLSKPGRRPSPPGARQSLLKNLFFSAVVVFLVLLLLHIVAYFGIRYQNDRQVRAMAESLKSTVPRMLDYSDLRIEFLHPFLKMTLVPDQELPFCRINHQGHRGSDFVHTKTGAFRIAILGGSAAMGWYANSEDETIHSCLQAELERSFPGRRFEVYNFANFQYDSTQELFLLETEALTYQPDFVIILSGINDFGWAIRAEQWRPYYPLGWLNISSIINPDSFQEDWQRRAALLRGSFKWSFLARTAWQNIKIRCSPALFVRRLFASRRTEPNLVFRDTEYALIEDRTELWARNIELMARLLDSSDIPYCASLQPFAFCRHQPTEAELRVLRFYIRSRPERKNAFRYWNAVYPAAEKALASRSYKIKTLELTRCFENVHETVYFDSCHFNARGTEILAQRYAEHIRPYVAKWTEKR